MAVPIRPIVTAGLCSLLRELRPAPDLVLFNICWSHELARQVAVGTTCAIGIAGEVSDEAAISYVEGLYRLIAGGNPLDYSHRMATYAARMYGLPEHRHIELFPGKDSGHANLVLTPPDHMPPPSRPATKPQPSAGASAKGMAYWLRRIADVVDEP